MVVSLGSSPGDLSSRVSGEKDHHESNYSLWLFSQKPPYCPLWKSPASYNNLFCQFADTTNRIDRPPPLRSLMIFTRFCIVRITPNSPLPSCYSFLSEVCCYLRVFNLENNAVILRNFEIRNFVIFAKITENNSLSTQTTYVRFRYLFVVITRYFGK